MAGKGGARPGAGRKPVHDEQRATELAKAAIIAKYGSIEKGLQDLLESDEPSLKKFVWEHAMGKPKEKVEHSGDVSIPQIVFVKAENCEPITKEHN